MKQIRNIKSIQVFGVVSRLKNVTHAADVLNISQSSVSYHIKKLETEICAPLFERKSNGLALTAEGAILSSYVERGLSSIQAGLEKVSLQTDSVRLAVLPMFASRWLSSRLGSFWENYPSLQLSFQNHNNTYVKMEHPETFADLGIQWGRGDWNGFHVTRLWSEKMVVVCGPEYLKANPIDDVSDLTKCTLLHVDDNRMWSEWFKNNNVEPSPSQTQMMLEDRHFQLSSTVNGLGVSLFAKCMIESELKSGSLINPFNQTFDTSFAYHLAIPKGVILSPSAIEFKDWLLTLCREKNADT